MTYNCGSPTLELALIKAKVVTVGVNIAETLVSMFSEVLVTWPLRLQLHNDAAMKLCNLIKGFQPWYLTTIIKPIKRD